jgi:hypothetical protein
MIPGAVWVFLAVVVVAAVAALCLRFVGRPGASWVPIASAILILLLAFVYDRLGLARWSGWREYPIRFELDGREVLPKRVLYVDYWHMESAELYLKALSRENVLSAWRDEAKELDLQGPRPLLEVWAGGEYSGLNLTNSIIVHRACLLDIVLPDNTQRFLVHELPAIHNDVTYQGVVTIPIPSGNGTP